VLFVPLQLLVGIAVRMASATPWAVLPQAQGASNTVEEKAGGEGRSQGEIQTSETTTAASSLSSMEDKEMIHQLARAVTQNSVKLPNGELINPFLGSPDPLLDPNSGKFSASAWTKTLLGIQSRDPERYPERTAGIAYKNLSAHGFGEATDYQKTYRAPLRSFLS
jgi:ATP-binding cassette subfamily G (WHITE) protein 2 (PDR)